MPQSSNQLDAPSASTSLSEFRLAAIVESSDDPIISKSLDGTILTWNYASERVFGYTAAEIIGQSIFLLIPPELHPDEREILARISQGERISHYETARLSKTGVLVPIGLTVSPIFDANDTIVGASSIMRDVSDRKRSEEATARLAAVVDSTDDAIVSKTLSGIVVSWNPAAARMYGYSAEEMVGQSIFRVIPADLVDEERMILAQVGEGHHVDHYETRRLRKDGSEITISLTISPIRDPSGKILGASSIKRDITKRKQSEMMFRQVAKMEAIGRLAGGLAHDFNNQLHALTGLASFVARDSGLSQDSRADLAEIQKGHERMASLTRQLLAFARQQVLKPEILDLNNAIMETRPLLQRLIGSSVEITLGLSQTSVWVRLDPAQLVQILMNLAINARDAMPRGGSLKIGTTPMDLGSDEMFDRLNAPVGPGAYVELTVEDSGTGIPEDQLPRIFDPFFTTKEVGLGTGLGLATVEGIVAQSGGYIRVETAPERGTTFRFLFQRASQPEDVFDPESLTAPGRGRGRLLIVEDETVVREVIARMLRNQGYEVILAENGREALELLAQSEGQVRMVISDIVMPVMGGQELGEHLQRLYPALPVLWVSGHPRESGYSGAHSTQPYLQKPVFPEALLQAVERLLKEAGRTEGQDSRV